MIDVHAHLYCEPLLDFLRSNPATAAGAKRAELPGASDSDAHLAERLRLMDEAGVSRQLLCCPPAPYPSDRGQGSALAAAVNDATARFVARAPNRFLGLASLPLPHVAESLAELERNIGRPGMAGVMLLCFCGALSVADEEFAPIFEAMDRAGSLLLLHPCVNGVCSPFITEWGLAGAFGPTVEDTTIVLHLLARKIPDRFRRIRIIVPHFGGSLPMLLERLDHQLQAGTGPLPEAPSATCRRLWYDSVSHGSTAALACAASAFGADRLLVGSDFPFLTQYEPYRETVGYVRRAGLSRDDLERVESGNATALLDIEHVLVPGDSGPRNDK